MRIVVGADHRGFPIRARIIEVLQRLGHEVEDVGAYSGEAVDYPDIAARVARKVSRGEVERGILICGTGLGMCITSNKFPGVRAAPCHDDLTAEMSRRHNDANILCLSADLLGERLVDHMIEIWLDTPFEGGRHARRVAKICELEAEIHAERRGDPKDMGGMPSKMGGMPTRGVAAGRHDVGSEPKHAHPTDHDHDHDHDHEYMVPDMVPA